MKKIVVVIMVSILLLSMLPVKANANSVIDYEAMGEHDGFAKAFYESYVTNSAYVAAKYTDNLGYVDGIIGQVKENARFMWDEFKNEECTNDDDCNWGTEFYKKLLAGAATAIDFIKGIFTKENEERSIPLYSQYFYISTGLAVVSGYTATFKNDLYDINVTWGSGARALFSYQYGTQRYELRIGSTNYFLSERYSYPNDILRPETVEEYLNIITQYGYTYSINRTSTDRPPVEVEKHPNFSQINNYIQNNNNLVHPEYKPEINAEMVCPTITTNLQIVGADLKANDEKLNVNKATGETVYNGEDCVVNFSAVMPQITDDNKIVVPNKDGTKTDVETNDKLDQDGKVIKPDYNGNPDNCDGVLCFMSSIIKSIAGMVTTIVDAITGVIDALFHLIVPEDMDFITDLFDSVKDKFNEKFVIATDIQLTFQSLFTEAEVNPLADLSFTLPIYEEEISFEGLSNMVDPHVPLLKKIMSAVIGLMTLIYVYRKITGSGGVMEK